MSIQRRASATIFEPPNYRGDAVLNCVDGCIPSNLATGTTPEIEEERRLLYVAMTRAKDHLYLIVPRRFFARQQHGGGDRHMYASGTRFIPTSIFGHFESRAWPIPERDGAMASKPERQPVDIGARLRRMWR